MKLKIELQIPDSIVIGQEIVIQIDTETQKLNFVIRNDNQVQQKLSSHSSFQEFMMEIIREKAANENLRTTEAYQSALNSFNKFVKGRNLALSEISRSVIEGYEAYLRKIPVCMNTVSFYMRILKAVYKRAVSQKLIADNDPFRNVYTGVARTRKRALDVNVVRQIRGVLPVDEDERLAKDLFLFSFYTRGMSFVDMAYLKKTDVRNGVLRYTRRKTGQIISVKWEAAMQEIVDSHVSYNDFYLLPIIKKLGRSERSQYRYAQYQVNKSLKRLGQRMMLPCDLTMYVARHSWASIAKSVDVPLSVISEAMGHSSEKMTSIYLKSLDEWRIHHENERIIHMLQ